MDCSQAQVWIADLDRNGVKEICVSGDPMSDDDVTWCLTYEAGELKPLPFEGAEYAQGRITGMDAEGMTMAGYVDALGTHMGIRRLTVEDGSWSRSETGCGTLNTTCKARKLGRSRL